MLEDKFFERFILRRIVKGVSYCNETNGFIVNDTSLSDENLKQILKEGKKYGYEEAFVKDRISSLAHSISFEPIHDNQYISIECCDIAVGQHLVVHTLDRDVGKNCLELLAVGNSQDKKEQSFLVLGTDRGVLRAGDLLVPVNNKWNRGYFVQFAVYRDEKRYPSDDVYYQTYAIDFFEFLNPSPMHEIMDEEELLKETQMQKTRKDEQKVESKNQNGVISYSWAPTVYTPKLAFKPNDFLVSDNKATFVITQQNEKEATYVVNPNFKLDDVVVDEKDDLFELLLSASTSNYKRSHFHSELLVSIKNEVPGRLKLKNGLWIIEKKVKIKFS